MQGEYVKIITFDSHRDLFVLAHPMTVLMNCDGSEEVWIHDDIAVGYQAEILAACKHLGLHVKLVHNVTKLDMTSIPIPVNKK